MQRRQFVSLAPGAVVAAAAAPAFLRNAFAQEAGITGKTLTIGCSAALTGPLAGLGQDVKPVSYTHLPLPTNREV